MTQVAQTMVLGLFASLLFVVDAHAQTKNNRDPLPFYEDRDGYEVLSVLLNARAEEWKNETVKIGSRTTPPRDVAEIKAQCSGIPPEFQGASEDFDKVVQSRFRLRKVFALKKNYELVYPSAMAGANHRETKEEGYRRIRSGTCYVTAVGFDEKRTRAIAFVQYICGSLCGSSLFYYLRKTAKGWEEASEVPPKVQSCGEIY